MEQLIKRGKVAFNGRCRYTGLDVPYKIIPALPDRADLDGFTWRKEGNVFYENTELVVDARRYGVGSSDLNIEQTAQAIKKACEVGTLLNRRVVLPKGSYDMLSYSIELANGFVACDIMGAGSESNGNGTHLYSSSTIVNHRILSLQEGSGYMTGATCRNIYFSGTSDNVNSLWLTEIAGKCGYTFKNCRFDYAKFFAVFRNPAERNQEFTEYCTYDKCTFNPHYGVAQGTYIKDAGTNHESFNGSGFTKCKFNMCEIAPRPAILIQTGAKPYNSHFDKNQFWVSNLPGRYVVIQNNSGKAAHFIGTNTIEGFNQPTGYVNSTRWADGDPVHFSLFGGITNFEMGSLQIHDIYCQGGPSSNLEISNVLTADRKPFTITRNIGSGETPTGIKCGDNDAKLIVHFRMWADNYEHHQTMDCMHNGYGQPGYVIPHPHGQRLDGRGWGRPDARVDEFGEIIMIMDAPSVSGLRCTFNVMPIAKTKNTSGIILT